MLPPSIKHFFWGHPFSTCFFTALLTCFVTTISTFALPAFPGAEGFGSTTPGGRGGKIYEVTTTKNSGTGSLREAIEAKGARIVLFRVSGTIPLESDLVIKHPNITIAGQTAPGDGICLQNYKLMISTKDVIVRYLRVRRGHKSGLKDDGIAIEEGENVIVDHCSVSWTTDEVVNTWHGAKNITIQWSIFSEGLHNASHGFAATLGGVNASYHHNLLANCPGRNASIGGNHLYQTHNMDYRNNVTFNWGHRTIDGKPNSINIVNNYFKPGANSTDNTFANIDNPSYQAILDSRWHVTGNYMEGNQKINANNREGITGETDRLVDTPFTFAPVTTVSAEEAYPMVLADVGATLPRRDAVDTRIIEEVTNGKNRYGKGVVLDPKDVGGWPELSSAAAPADTDHDGMPDTWEEAHGLNPDNASDGNNDRNSDGYTNIEEYINSLVNANPTVILHKTATGANFKGQQNILLKVQPDGWGHVLYTKPLTATQFSILSLEGRRICRGTFTGNRGTFFIGNQPAGIYVLQISGINRHKSFLYR